MSAHATLAPSSASRWIACPGSVRLTADLPDTESEHAALGTFAHTAAAHCLAESERAETVIGCTGFDFHADGSLDHRVDQEMVDTIQEYLDVVHAVANDYTQLLVEQRVEQFLQLAGAD